MRIPRELHPVAWWCWAIGLAVAATSTTNPVLLGLVVAVTCLVVLTCRSDQPWARAFRLYLWVGAAIVVIRVLFRLVLGGNSPGHVWIALPEVPLPDWAAGVSLLGPFTREEFLAGAYDGLRLAGLVIAVGAANALANPKRLMKSLPPALYEVGTAMVVAISVLPQLADSARRVRAAQRLRGGDSGRIRGLRRLVVPVLEDALERSLSLAAGMDARGYGRTCAVSAGQRRSTGALMIGGLLGVCVGVYAVLDGSAPRLMAVPMLLLGTALALAGFVVAGRRVRRTRYRPTRWQLPEFVVAASGVVVGAGAWAVQRWDYAVAHPGVTELPAVSLPSVLVVLVAVVPVWAAPPPVTTRTAAPVRADDPEVVPS
ncbi:energy-coupling factor transporter transmembrane protein EcfT [Nocardioides panacisoli]|uniref:energy-coupling factor transporter transmembrane component T n=1 Tax=Nocardioides panacisoli TaxID=627624 RepID=UPI001C62E67D|nr:energy-coupling factor transporter transmembrane component T [Nocardioides panacisoli]QYJ04457.1 energy-coupling factor transporter transmembrane protein EcfT [Nocardioides panacisoli]